MSEYYYKCYNYLLKCFMGIGIGDWGLGIGPNPQSPIPNPQYYEYFLYNKL